MAVVVAAVGGYSPQLPHGSSVEVNDLCRETPTEREGGDSKGKRGKPESGQSIDNSIVHT